MPNTRLAYEVLDDIVNNPQEWDQGVYIAKTDCGTAACFAGRVVLRAGAVPSEFTLSRWGQEVANVVLFEGKEWEIPVLAEHLLGAEVCNEEDEDLFAAHNTRDDLEHIVEELFGSRPADMPQKIK